MLTSSAGDFLFSRLKLPLGLTLLPKVAFLTSIEANIPVQAILMVPIVTRVSPSRVTEKCSLERALKHLKKEATIWIQLDDIHVAKFYGVAEVGGRPALILEWCSQGTATDYLKSKSLHERLGVIRSLATGLAYVHSRNVVHGDLKGVC
ncbi:TKL/TKL-ccin protein kinase [Mycena venus]|uniref:TKL/TKL-ccin protein kinase n=1 Tax=Mycena venus TaxID=2733690 RepID=A0A8H6XKM0_9AGAR|nr:TKL/TKL-ccin protein kinase [Mycena venus]